MASGVFNNQKKQAGSNDWVNDDIRVLLVGTGYTFDPDALTIGDAGISGNELSGTGYSRQALANKVVNYDATNDVAKYDADDVVYAGANFGTIGGAIVYKHDATTEANSVPIAYSEMSEALPTNGGQMTVQWGVDGVFKAQ